MPLPIPFKGHLPRLRRQHSAQGNNQNENKELTVEEGDSIDGDSDIAPSDEDSSQSDHSHITSPPTQHFKQQKEEILPTSEARFTILFRRKLASHFSFCLCGEAYTS